MAAMAESTEAESDDHHFRKYYAESPSLLVYK
jgi:hypothetical protein